ncbi:hypothetical protein PFISCL1PPCAC_16964, partial [Pristionchus fissidentatus]
VCEESSVVSDCATGQYCQSHVFSAGPPAKVSCPAGSSLQIGGTAYDNAQCSAAGWKGFASSGDTAGKDLTIGPLEKIKVQCLMQHKMKLCDDSAVINTCSSAVCTNAKPKFDTTTPSKLKCPADYFLVIDDVMYKEVECTQAGGWAGTIEGTVKQLIDYNENPFQKIRARCQPYCDKSMVIDACATGTCGATLDYDPSKKLKCSAPGFFFEVDGANYKDVSCTEDGWTGVPLSGTTSTKLVDYAKNPFQKISAKCQSYCSESTVEVCSDCAAKHSFLASTGKLTCPTNHYMKINNEYYNEVTCAAGKWEGAGTPPTLIHDSNSNIEKIKPKCYSSCDLRFIKRDCTAPCNKPVYIADEGKLFCQSPDDILHFEGAAVSFSKCDQATGWKDDKGTVVKPFSATKTTEVTATCQPRPATLPPAITTPTVIETTTASTVNGTTTNSTVTNKPDENADSNASKANQGGSNDTLLYVVIVVVVLGVSVCAAMFFVYMRKRKQGSEEDTSRKSSTSKDNSKKKGKKGSKKGGKKAKSKNNSSKKKTKKDKKKKKEKSKKEEAIDMEDDPEMPEHQMSLANSSLPLTAALAVIPPANPNVM